MQIIHLRCSAIRLELPSSVHHVRTNASHLRRAGNYNRPAICFVAQPSKHKGTFFNTKIKCTNDIKNCTNLQLEHQKQSDNFRESVAKSIRENVARLRARANGKTQIIDYPGTNGVITDNGSNVIQPEMTVTPRLTPSGVVPIVHIPLPVLRQPQPAVLRPEPVFVNQPEPEVIIQQTEPTVVREPEPPVPLVTLVEENRLDGDGQVFSADDEQQAQNAHYSFDSSVQDTINEHSHTRQETR